MLNFVTKYDLKYGIKEIVNSLKKIKQLLKKLLTWVIMKLSEKKLKLISFF